MKAKVKELFFIYEEREFPVQKDGSQICHHLACSGRKHAIKAVRIKWIPKEGDLPELAEPVEELETDIIGRCDKSCAQGEYLGDFVIE